MGYVLMPCPQSYGRRVAAVALGAANTTFARTLKYSDGCVAATSCRARRMLLEKTAAVGSEPGACLSFAVLVCCLVTAPVHAWNTSHGSKYTTGRSRPMVAQQPSRKPLGRNIAAHILMLPHSSFRLSCPFPSRGPTRSKKNSDLNQTLRTKSAFDAAVAGATAHVPGGEHFKHLCFKGWQPAYSTSER